MDTTWYAFDESTERLYGLFAQRQDALEWAFRTFRRPLAIVNTQAVCKYMDQGFAVESPYPHVYKRAPKRGRR